MKRCAENIQPIQNPATNTHDRHKNIIYCIIILLTFVLYANTLSHKYAYDDGMMITYNVFTQKGVHGICEILSHDTFQGFLGESKNLSTGGRYRPLSLVTFAVERSTFGQNPHISHFINILLYALTGIMIYIILLRLLKLSVNACHSRDQECHSRESGNPVNLNALDSHSPIVVGDKFHGNDNMKWYFSIPFLTALLFIAHPIHTEVVANIKSRDEIMSLFGALLSLLFTLKYLEGSKRRYLFYSSVSFFLALMSKENAITFTVIIPLSVYFFTRHAVKKNLSSLVPIFLAAIAFLVIREAVLGGFQTDDIYELINNPFVYASTPQKYATISYTLGVYIKLLFYPHPLTADYYPYHIPIINWADPRAIIPLIIYIFLASYALAGLKRKNVISYGILYFLITISIVSNIFFSVGTPMAERFDYIPSLGFCLIIAYLISEKIPRLVSDERKLFTVTSSIMMVILSFYSYKTIVRNAAWRDNITLFSTDVITSHDSAKVNSDLGRELMRMAEKAGNVDGKNEYLKLAIRYLTRALEIHPESPDTLFLLADAHYALNKDFELSIGYLEKGIKLYPMSSEKYFNLGTLYLKYKKDAEKAVQYFEEALRLKPKNAEAYNNLGAIYFDKGDYKKAGEMFQRAAEFNQGNPKIYTNLALVYEKLGDPAKAKEYTNKAKQLGKKP